MPVMPDIPFCMGETGNQGKKKDSSSAGNHAGQVDGCGKEGADAQPIERDL